MNGLEVKKIIANIIYIIGAGIALFLLILFILGNNIISQPDSMAMFNLREQAFITLGFGAVPMIVACCAVYKFNCVKDSRHKKRNFILLFLPGFICGICAAFIAGTIILGFISMGFRAIFGFDFLF